MTKITAIVRADKLKAVEQALREVGAPGFTYYDVKGHGREVQHHTHISSGSGTEAVIVSDIVADVLPRVKFEIVCAEDKCAATMDAIRKASSTNEHGDGIIYTEEVGTITRIQTGEVGDKAL